MRKSLIMLLCLLITPSVLGSQSVEIQVGGHDLIDTNNYLYRASFIQAAPGKLLELIELFRKRAATDENRDENPLLMRHSQGDRWDLMILYPMGSYVQYYKLERVKKRAYAMNFQWHQFRDDIAWQEDEFVYGPPWDEVNGAWNNAGFFHVEIFQSLPAKQLDLIKERDMENAYLKKLGQPTNLVFTRDQGAAWDCFTIGFYRDLQHYAESAKSSPEDAEAAAKAAGFKSAKDIGPYLRTLIALHHDTLAVAIK
jgi:hypothetical protein